MANFTSIKGLRVEVSRDEAGEPRALYVYGPADRDVASTTEIVYGAVFADQNAEGDIVGVEILLPAVTRTPHPQLYQPEAPASR